MPSAMPLDKGTLFVIDRLRANGYEANVVGGSVRNHLLGIPVTDVDITTSAHPETTKKVFSDLRVIETGIKHGTVTVLLDGTPYEITTYRTDGEYLDNRHPSSVTFTPNLRDDLSRRDFTVNAICYNHYDGYTDLFDGMGDLERKLIRAVGDPETRFREDALRIFRAIRFASVLGFDIEANTSLAVHKTRGLLANVSRERIYVEWEKLLSGSSAFDVIDAYRDVIAAAIPELSNLILPSRKLFDLSDVKTKQLAIFYLSTPDPVSSFEGAMTTLHTDNNTKFVGREALRAIDSVDLSDKVNITEAIYTLGTQIVGATVELGICLGKFSEAVREAFRAVLASDAVTSVADLAIGGADLIAIGLRGKRIGEMLDRLVRAVIRSECKNDRDALLNYAINLK